MYFFKLISDDARTAQLKFQKHTKTKRLILGSFFSCLASLLQSSGGLFPGIGYIISPFATAPILFCSVLSLPLGFMSFILSIMLLLILQPSELIVFSFTTGLLGLGIGAAICFFRKRVNVIIAGAILLSIGIISLLYVFHFPVLGPAVSDSFSFLTTGSIFFFAFLYSWLWVEIALFFLIRLKTFIT